MLAELIAGKVERGSVFICLVMVVVVVKLALCSLEPDSCCPGMLCKVPSDWLCCSHRHMTDSILHAGVKNASIVWAAPHLIYEIESFD